MRGLERLWAPWRGRFLRQKRPRRCFLCAAKRSRRGRVHHVVLRGATVFAVLNRYPYSNGHLLAAPYRHVGRFEAIRPVEWSEMLEVSQVLMRRLRRAIHPHGFNVGLNIGLAGGAGLPGHLHLHIVPRWHGDTNFMPILGGTKVISQSLQELAGFLAAEGRRAR